MGQMRQVQRRVGVKMGCDVDRAPQPVRVALATVLCLIAVLVKTLVDAGVITDAQLQATLTAARDDFYDPEPAEPPPPLNEP
jgi:hypothetical protein